MKLKNFALITENKVTEIFCIADDFCKVFDAQMAKYTFKAERKRKYHRESRMSKAEIMVIMILVVNLLGGIAAYCYFPRKPSIRVQTVDISNDRQLTLF